MKTFLLLIFLSLFIQPGIAQPKQTFDIITFAPPKAWKTQTGEGAFQLSKEDPAKGTYCLITLFKAVPGTANGKENFDLAWTSIVKEMVNVAAAPEMQAPATDEGWEIQNGYAPFEKDGTKGVVVLITSTGFEKMVNAIILTNTDVYEKDITTFLESISFIKPVVKNNTVTVPAKQAAIQPLAGNGFAFTTTTYDDGWVATEQADWVQVTKGNTRVLIHYPNKQADAYNSVLMDGLKNAWNILVAPSYSSAYNMEFKPTGGWEAIEFAEADMTEKASGKTVHVVLFKKDYSNGSGKYVEFITPNKSSFEQEFGNYQGTMSGAGFEKMENMAFLNKFAVSATDLSGKWTSDFSGAIQYVNAYTGFDAGMDTHASAESYQFSSGNTYKWDLAVASGPVGNIKFQSVKSGGKFTMNGNWKVNFSDIEGKPRNYDVYFSCIKGLRILWINNKPFAKAG